MAIFRSAAIVSSISGNLGGLNFSRGRQGPYIRKRLSRTNRKTPAQLAQRSRFTSLTRHWSDLTGLETAAWNTSARLVATPNRLGVPTRLSGFQFFIQYNLAHVDDPTFIDTPPTILTRTPVVTDIGGNLDEILFFTVFFTVPPTSTNYDVYISAGRPYSDVRPSFWNNWKFLKKANVAQGAQLVDIEAEFIATFGDPVQGEHIKFQLKSHLPDTLFSPFVQGGAIVQ